MSKSLVVLAFLLALASCMRLGEKKVHSVPLTSSLQSQLWFDEQLIDHFNLHDNRTYAQRYWVLDTYFDREYGPVFLYICGEYTCPGVPDERQYPVVLARKFGALLLVLEHRYYGASQPFGEKSWSYENLKYLTVNLALADLAYFIKWAKNTGLAGINSRNPWITIGGSYPGALSAWFRYKYPHLTVGALASSAVVNSILDFTDFDHQIMTSTLRSGPECPENIRNVTRLAEFYLETPDIREDFLRSWNAEKLSNPEFLFFLADVFVELVQYGKREYLCDMLANKSVGEQLDAVRAYSLAFAPPQGYGAYFLSNETVDVDKDMRQWTYQTCQQVGWFQTFYPNETLSMRSRQVSLSFYRQWCRDTFGADVWPSIEDTNLEFGGKNMEAFNLIFTNGGEALYLLFVKFIEFF